MKNTMRFRRNSVFQTKINKRRYFPEQTGETLYLSLMKIRIIEDEEDLLDNMSAYLSAEGYRCEHARYFLITFPLSVIKI